MLHIIQDTVNAWEEVISDIIKKQSITYNIISKNNRILYLSLTIAIIILIILIIDF